MFFNFDWASYKFFLERYRSCLHFGFDMEISFLLSKKIFKSDINILIIGAGDAGKTIAKEILQRPMLK